MSDVDDFGYDDEDGPLPSEQPTIDAADVREVRRRTTRRELQQRISEKFWRDLLSTELGRRELWGLLVSAHTFEERFACGPSGFPQKEATWFHAGEQAFGLRLYQSWLRLGPELIALMHAENDSRFVQPKQKREE